MAIDSVGSIMENRTKFAKYFEDTNDGEMTIDTFYRLLVAEMQNQDPLEPMSNTEFISQMASFTSLQVQQEALYYNNSNYAASMVGKEVIVASSTGAGMEIKSGVVTSVNLTGGEFKITVNGKEYALEHVMEVVDSRIGTAGSNDGAYATSLIGRNVTVAKTGGSGDTQIESGIVQRIEILEGNISVVIDNYAYPLDSVIKVEPASTASDNDVEKEAEEEGESEETTVE